jgi:oligopeptidase B
MTAHAWISKELFEEMKARIKENDESVPYLYNGYYYITRLKQVKIILFILEKRKPFSKEEIMLDCNELAKGKIFQVEWIEY